jgi:phosphatidylethanolamine-binding protein (PEBP) family uncharacterized protein
MHIHPPTPVRQRAFRTRSASCGPVARAARPATAALTAAAAALALGACGSSSKGGGRTAATRATTPSGLAGTPQGATTPPSSGLHASSIRVSSSAPYLHGGMDPRYTCHGQEISPPFKWHDLAESAPRAKELLFLVRTVSHGNLSTDWALAGLSPSLSGLSAGQTPPGAIVGRNSAGKVGYSLCPPSGSLVTMAVYAVTRKLGLKPGFDPESIKPVLEAADTQWGGMTFAPYPPKK